MRADSLASVPERELVRFLYANLHHYRHITVPPRVKWPFVHRLEVTPSDLGLPRAAFGDIDALLMPSRTEEQSAAVQFKRAKLTSSSYATREPSKLGGLRKLVHQANALARLGFSSVWIVVLTVVDTRDRDLNWSLPLGHTALMDRIYKAIPLADLHPDVGVHVTELAQTLDRPISETGQFGGYLLRMATQRDQPDDLTARIRTYAGKPEPHD